MNENTRAATYLRAREMLNAFRDECHPTCWTAVTLAGYNRQPKLGIEPYETLDLQIHDSALGIACQASVAGDNIEGALAALAKEYGAKRAEKISACLSVIGGNIEAMKAMNNDSKPVESATEEGEVE